MSKEKWLLALCASMALIGTGSYAVTQASQATDLKEASSVHSAAVHVHGVPAAYEMIKGQDPNFMFQHPDQELQLGDEGVAVVGLDADALHGADKDVQVESAIETAKHMGRHTASAVTLFGAEAFQPLQDAAARSELVGELAQVSSSYGTDSLVLDVEGVGEAYRDQLQALVDELAAVSDFTLAVPTWEYDAYLKNLAIPHNVTVLGVNGYRYLRTHSVGARPIPR